jgi:hypothetical protein
MTEIKIIGSKTVYENKWMRVRTSVNAYNLARLKGFIN